MYGGSEVEVVEGSGGNPTDLEIVEYILRNATKEIPPLFALIFGSVVGSQTPTRGL